MEKAGETARVRKPRNWREMFLDNLAQTSNVAASARAAGVDVSTVYKARRSESSFSAAWQDALCEGYDALEMDLLCRLREGETRDKDDNRKFDNATSFRLLISHRETVGKARAVNASESEKDIIEGINAKLDLMRERMKKVKAKGDKATPPAGEPDVAKP